MIYLWMKIKDYFYMIKNRNLHQIKEYYLQLIITMYLITADF